MDKFVDLDTRHTVGYPDTQVIIIIYQIYQCLSFILSNIVYLLWIIACSMHWKNVLWMQIKSVRVYSSTEKQHRVLVLQKFVSGTVLSEIIQEYFNVKIFVCTFPWTMKINISAGLFLLCQRWGFMCNYKSYINQRSQRLKTVLKYWAIIIK